MRSAHSHFLEMRLKARTGIWIEAWGALAVMLCGYAAVTYLIDRNLRLEWPFRLVLLGIFVFYAGRLLRDRLLKPLGVGLSDDEMAIAVERAAPDVKQALISSVQFERALGSGAAVIESRAMMAAVVDEVSGRLQGIPFMHALDAARVRKFAAMLAVAVLAFGTWGVADFDSMLLWARRNLTLSTVEWPRYTQFDFRDVPDGGEVRVPQGDPQTFTLTVRGPVPDQVFLYYEFQGGESGSEPMSATGEREFTWTLPAVLENATIWAEGGDGESRRLQLKVVERPRIEGVAVRIVYPDYMHKERTEVAPTESEVKVPRGGYLELAGKSHKPIQEAFLLVGTDRKVPLDRDDDHAFHGEFHPEATCLLEMNVIDTDQLGSNSPPKLMLRLVDDRPPTLDLRLRGIGMLITPHARIPGDLKVKDDFGIQAVAAALRWVVDTAGEARPPGQTSEPAAEVPFVPAEVNYGSDLSISAVRYETTTMVDLLHLNHEQDQNSEKNTVRPGMLLSLRFAAKDNYGPKDPHESFSEVVTFRVVTSDKLMEELRRRQIELRTELRQILDEERTAQIEIKEMLSPTSTNEKAPQAKARLRALARQQTALGRRAGFVGENYQKVLWEYENNRMWESSKVREVEAVITAPLEALAKGDFPVTSRQVETFSQTGDEAVRTDAIAGYDAICKKLEDVIKNMEQAETLAALLESLRNLINVEDHVINDVEKQLREKANELFRPHDKK